MLMSSNCLPQQVYNEFAKELWCHPCFAKQHLEHHYHRMLATASPRQQVFGWGTLWQMLHNKPRRYKPSKNIPPGYRLGMVQIRTNAPAVLQKIVKNGNAVPMQDSRNNRKTEHKKRADYRIFAGNNGITYRLQ